MRNDSLIEANTSFEAEPKRAVFDANKRRYLGQGQAFPPKDEEARIPSIVILLFSRSPFAIAALIASAIVLSFKRMSWWTWPHVLKKSGEGITPTVTDRDSAATIPLICMSCFEIAPVENSSPDSIFHCRGSTMCCESENSFIRFKTAAAFGIPSAQVVSHHGKFNSAITLAQPECPSFPTRGALSRCLAYYRKSLELLSDKTDCSHINNSNISTNGKMEELLALTAKSSKAEGVAQQKANPT